MKFEDVYPGMHIVVRKWESLVQEFGVRPTGTVDCPYGFNDHVMKDTCGKVAVVVSIHQPDAFGILIIGAPSPEEDSYHPCTFEPLTWAALPKAFKTKITNDKAKETKETKKTIKKGGLTLLQGGKK